MAKKKKVELVNHIAILLDKSGSMQSLRQGAIDAFNRNVAAIRENAKKHGQKTTVSLYSFNSVVIREHAFKDPEAFCELTSAEYWPNGNTALFDAVGQAVRDFEARPDAASKNTSFLIVVVTDGEENASSLYSHVTVTDAMRRLQATDRWSFAYAVPRGWKDRLVKTWCVPEGNVTEWDQTDAGIKDMCTSTLCGFDSYYTMRSAGESSTQSFYTTDLSKVSVKSVKSKLDEVTSSVNVWEVEKECDIRDFCEKKSGKPMLKGAAFYELTKKEKEIQDHKALVIMHRDSGKVYHGAAARDLLGLPSSGTVRVVPGNHSKFRVFVQSTSTNRKLVRGTKVVYYPQLGVPYKEGKSAK